jgi:hypothetical protein
MSRLATPKGMQKPGAWFRLLEHLTAASLVAVLLALGWMIVVACRPSWLRLGSVEVEVIVLLALLTTALGLVSAAALIQTRSGPEECEGPHPPTSGGPES